MILDDAKGLFSIRGSDVLEASSSSLWDLLYIGVMVALPLASIVAWVYMARMTWAAQDAISKMTFLKIVTGLSLAVVSLIFRGFVLSILWNWFVPAVAAIHTIGIAEATGLSPVVVLLSGFKTEDDDEKELSFIRVVLDVVRAVAHSLIALAFGYIVHLFL
jgi:hypothetical protein